MSRIGRMPIAVPQGTKVELREGTFVAEGPRGRVEQALFAGFPVEIKESEITVSRPGDGGPERSRHGLLRALLANAVQGVSAGFQKQLDIVGVGYKAEARPYGLQLALGFSHPVEYRAPEGIKLTAPVPTQILIDGANKEIVGQVAAELRSLRPPEPYKGKGIKYVGEQIRRKAGKAGGK